MIKATIQNQSVRAEAGALHYLQGQIQIEAAMPTAASFLKSFATSETIFKPTYTGTGTIYFGPPIFGEYMVLELNGDSWVVDRGAYVCSDITVEVGAWRNQAATALFSSEGWFQTSVSGKGQVVIQAHGPIEVIDLVNDRLVVDGSFAVARQAHLRFAVQKATKGWLTSAASGEGLVNVIEGTGRVLISPFPNIHNNLIHSISGLIPRASS